MMSRENQTFATLARAQAVSLSIISAETSAKSMQGHEPNVPRRYTPALVKTLSGAIIWLDRPGSLAD
jgi:hypothetical protein